MKKRKQNNKTKVFIAIPSGGTIRPEILLFVWGIKDKYDIRIGVTCKDRAVENRNLLVDTFLKTDCEWILFLDADTAPPLGLVDMTKNGKGICSGVYHVWMDQNLVPLLMKRTGSKYDVIDKEPESHLVEVDGIGGGSLLIHRRVFAKLKKPYFLDIYSTTGFRVLGNDYYFCEKAQKAGYKIWVDLRYCSKHFNNIDLKEIDDWMKRLMNIKGSE